VTEKHYSAPWGRKIWLVTGLVVGLGLSTAVALPLILPPLKADTEGRWGLWLTTPVVTLAVVGGTSLWMIRRFELTDDAIQVRRSFWINRIPLSVIQSVEADPDACKGAWKTMGNDGLFAMHGRFRSKRLGKFQAFVTNPMNSIVLKVTGDTVVISPETPRSFVKELNRRRDRFREQR
jgi:hypothetical protein